MNRILTCLFLNIMCITFAAADDGSISGLIKDAQSQAAAAGVIVKIQNSNRSTIADGAGHFIFENVASGNHYLVFIKTGYYSLIIPDVKVESGRISELTVDLYPGDEREYLFLEIGGIHVTANRDLLPEEPETIHRISSGEIEHMQANSLTDVLDMIPGNERRNDFGLQRKPAISLRGFDNPEYEQGAMFGTKIIVDDVPLSNNAGLQSGVGVGYGFKVPAMGGSQYDLREIVAENIEKVEVHSGASSVEYGDHSNGLILVRTKNKGQASRLKLKNNPDTREANFMGSVGFYDTNLLYNFNYGYSERDIRVSGDEYHRLAVDVKTSNHFWNNDLFFNQNLKYSRIIEEDNDTSDPFSTKAFNRDQHFTYSQLFEYNRNQAINIYWRNYLDFKQRNSWSRRMESTDLGIWSDRTEAGTREGILGAPIYFSEVWTRGREWSYGSKLKAERKMFTANILHRLLMGGEFQADDNNGSGKSFDVLNPPGGRSGHRPRSFDAIPGMKQFALFAEDRLTGEWPLPFTLDLGFRLDSYNPQGLRLSNLFKNKDFFLAKQGTFFNPRLGLRLKLADNTQLRFIFSKSSKIPSLAAIYTDKFYLDILEDAVRPSFENAGDTIKLVSTYVYDRSAPRLKGYQSTKYEAAVDQQLMNVRLSLVGYVQQEKRLPREVTIPYQYTRYEWPHWPDSSNRKLIESLLLTSNDYKVYRNLQWTKSSGLEFTLETRRLATINMRFRINAAFNFRKYGSEPYPLYAGNTRRLQAGDTLTTGWVVPENMEIIPYYRPVSAWRQRMVINYSADYIAKALGIWLTFKAQQVLLDKSLDADSPKLSADGYYHSGQHIAIDDATSALMQLDRSVNPLDVTVDKSKPDNEWLFGITVSKSLFKGAEVSLFVENIFNDRAYYKNRLEQYSARNPEIFWGIAFSSKLDGIFE